MSVTRKIFLFIGLPLVITFAIAIGWAFEKEHKPQLTSQGEKVAESACRTMTTPVDMSLVTSILYPGQERGGHYKAHGGFRFDGSANDEITVRAPYDPTLVAASRYIESGEVQYLLEFKADCGLTYRFDHFKTLSAKLQEMAENLPEAKEGDSRAHRPTFTVKVTAGEIIATAVGLSKRPDAEEPNTFVDLGVYDKKNRNQISLEDPEWAKKHEAEQNQAWYGICWFDSLPSADRQRVLSLPASGDDASSDYCSAT